MPIQDSSGVFGFDFKDVTQPLTPTVSSPPCSISGGSCIAVFDQVPFDYFWEVEQISVSNTSNIITSAKVFIDFPYSDINVIASTTSGNFDQDDVNSPIIVLPTKSLAVVWNNCSLGAIGSVRLQVKAKILTPAARSLNGF